MTDTPTYTVVNIDSGVLVFPDGIQQFTKKIGVDVLFIDHEGGLTTLVAGDSDWKEYPSDDKPIRQLRAVPKKEPLNDKD